MAENQVATRAELALRRAEVTAHLAAFERVNADRSVRFGIRYEAAIMIDVCNETLAEIEELLKLLPGA
jgi:hypothetical protein